MQLVRAGSSGLASSIVALNLKCAFGSSGLERMGLESGGLEKINCIWHSLELTGLESKKLEASKSIWLERIGLEPCGLEVSQSIWLERARAKGQETLNRSDQTDHFWSPY